MRRPARAPLSELLVATAACAAAWHCCSDRGFVAGGPRQGRHSAVARWATKGGEEGWQQGLDKALLDVDATPAERLQGFAKAVSSPVEILQAFGEAAEAIREKGIAKGHPAALDALFPRGTIARSDLEGLVAVARQAPELVDALQESQESAQSSGAPPRSAAPSPPPDFAKLLSPEVLNEAAEEVRNIFRRTPSGLEQPAFEVVLAGTGFDVRRYVNFTVAARRMASSNRAAFSSAEGFTALAGYLFGDNEKEQAMKMTMPVEISYDDSLPDAQDMSFVLPSENAMAVDGPPQPRDPTVQIYKVPERFVAAREFSGIATTQEVERQREKLLASLQEEGSYAPVEDGQYSVLQYNPPYTLPWRRRNEIAVVVAKQSVTGSPNVTDTEL